MGKHKVIKSGQSGFKILKMPKEAKDRELLHSLRKQNGSSSYDPDECHKFFFDDATINTQDVQLTKVKDTVAASETVQMHRLEDIIDHWDYLPESMKATNRFFTKFMVFKVNPENLKDAIVVFCNTCNRQTSFESVKKGK